MKNIVFIAILFFQNLIFGQAMDTSTSHQTAIVRGTIIDHAMNGEPLLYAHIELENTPWSTRTNLNGNFEMNGVASGNYVLAVSFPGYETLKMPVRIEENEVTKIQGGLSIKSLDVSSLMVSDLDSGVQGDALAKTQ